MPRRVWFERGLAHTRCTVGAHYLGGMRQSSTNAVESLTVFGLPEQHRRRLRTSTVLKRTNRELKRHTRVASLFPNEASALRLVSVVLAETSDEWETGRLYLSMQSG